MHTGIIAFQTIIVIFCLLYCGIVFAMPENRFTKLMLAITFSVFIMNIGCLMELYCETVDGGIFATQTKYVGAVYLATCFLTFCVRYCEWPVYKWLHVGLICWDTLLLALVWSNSLHHLFFKEIYYSTDAVIPGLAKTKGILFFVYMASNMIQMLICVYITLHCALKTTNPRKKRNYIRLFCCVTIPLVLYAVSFLPALKGYDVLPASVSVSMFIMFYGMAVRKDFLISEIAHETILQNLQDPIIVVDANYEIMEANLAAERLLPIDKYRSKEYEIPVRLIDRILEGGEVERVYDGKTYIIHGRDLYVGEILLGYCLQWLDITEQKERMMQMERLKNEADHANHVKSEFLASMSHEIRTPLNAIVGLNDIIVKETTQQEIKDYATDVARSSRLLLALVNDILDMAKIESNKLEIIPTEYVLRDILDDLFNMHAVKAKEKGLRLDFVIDPFLPAVLYGDDIRIQQVMTNLLSNAVKYTEKGSVTVKISGKKDGKDLLLHVVVKDTGMGIRQEDILGIRDKFSRVYEKTTRYEEGTGLGLSISIRLLRLMNSELEIESTYGEGSTFSFVVRQPIVDDTDIFAYDTKKAEAVVDGDDFVIPSAKILSVDDNEINLKLFRLLLKPMNCQLECVTSGAEALKKTRQYEYDLIFLDHMMPEMDGIETREKMLSDESNLNKETPIIMLTANAISGAKEEYLEMGFQDYLMKPIDIPALKAILRAFLPDKLVKKD